MIDNLALEWLDEPVGLAPVIVRNREAAQDHQDSVAILLRRAKPGR
jgi:hypothetical protein